MADCPVRGCTRQIRGYSAKSQAKYAAELEPFIDMLRRLASVWDTPAAQREFGATDTGWTAKDITEMADTGAEIEEAIHTRGAHGAMGYIPTVDIWRGWKESAAVGCVALAIVDKQWCIQFWEQKKRSGVKVPFELRSGLKQAGVVV